MYRHMPIVILYARHFAQEKSAPLPSGKVSADTQFANRILDFFNLNRYFHFTSGSNLDGSRTRKSEVIEFALNECRREGNSNVVMIGDRKHDIIGAKEQGIDSIGVLYGYGSRHELEKENPTHIVDNVDDLRKVLLSCLSQTE